MKVWKHVSLLLSICLSAGLFAGCASPGTGNSGGLSDAGRESASESASESAGEVRPGLYTENGVLMYGGEKFRGIGVNYLGLFYNALNGEEEGIDSLETLAEYGVKCVRVPVNATYTEEVMRLQFEDANRWWSLLDRIVEKAEETGVGLICGFFWSEDVIPGYFDEDIAESMREGDSRSWAYMEEYIRTFIGRYGESEAIWGWEYGNEIMLEAQIPGSLSGGKRFGCDDVTALYERFIACVREYDPYDRFIGSGDAGLRPFSYNGYYYNATYADTREEQTEMCGKLYPMEGVSWHAYSDSVTAIDQPDLFVDPPLFNDGKGGEITLYTTWKEYLGYISALAASNGKVAYLGETAFTYADSDREVSYAEVYRATEGILRAVYETDFPLAIVWNYDPFARELSTETGTSDRWGDAFSEHSERGKAVLACIRDYNRKIDESLRN